MDIDPELFWESYGQNVYQAPSPNVEEDLKRIFPLDSMLYPTFRLTDRLEFAASAVTHLSSPMDVAHYLNVESLAAAYPRSAKNQQFWFLRIALHQWAYYSRDATLREQWERTFEPSIAAGANLRVLSSRETSESLNDSESERQVVVELISHFIGPYVSSNGMFQGGPVVARDTFHGLQLLISRLRVLGIELETLTCCKRLEICFDDLHLLPFCHIWKADTSIEPHILSVCYNDDLSTWEVWNSTYEEHCGEFWASLEDPERVIPGSWIE